MKMKQWTTVLLVSSALAACGGGSSVGSTAAPSNSMGPLSLLEAKGDGGGGYNNYVSASGATQMAQLTAINHTAFVELLLFSIFESDDKGDGYVFRSDTDLTAPEKPTTSLMPDAVKDEIVQLMEQYVAQQRTQARPVNSGTIACPYGGYFVVSGDLNDSTNTGTLNVNYTNCETYLYLKNGLSTLTLNKLEPTNNVFLDYAIAYKDLSVDTAWNAFVYTGSQFVVKTMTNNRVTKIVTSSNLQRKDQKAGDAVSIDLTVNSRDQTAQAITGKLCHGVYGCVDVSTRIGFSNRLQQGEINLVGAGGSTIQLYYSGGKLHTRLDGNGTGNYGAPYLVTL
ncbi:MAG: hypothetical protein QJT81_04120 [Candidatus Thiothrix putei]|uniref:Lipoprotein n=2 Tax=Thiothrix TaxID=1030 RepID=A0A1H4G5A7_9GAMM|nr:hypothetical protein [Thiothrix caldifontis]WGZ95188.1 MAG: hypothetical protein QJT81_04120 [Candidatus Thiothrix putei]SEB04779.1 hypothetical protein SAMN05660964_03281 [Thiothrix caldifontis]